MVWWCGGVFVLVWWCGGVFVVVWWCFRAGVVVWWCFCGGVCVVVFLWWCGGVFVVVLWWCFCGVLVVVFLWCFSRKRPRRVPSKKGLSLKIVIKHRPKFYWSDGCLERLSSNIAQSSTEVMAVFKDCHQTSPKVLLKWWLSLKIVIKHSPKFYWSDGCL